MTDSSPEHAAIRGYVEDQFLVTYGEDFQSDTNLFAAGIMDSFGYVQLVEFLQIHFGVTFDDDAILGNVMVSVDRMAAAVGNLSTSLPKAG